VSNEQAGALPVWLGGPLFVLFEEWEFQIPRETLRAESPGPEDFLRLINALVESSSMLAVSPETVLRNSPDK
jgi:hypothetical protein